MVTRWSKLYLNSSPSDFDGFCHFWPHGPRWMPRPKTTLRMLVLTIPLDPNSYLKSETEIQSEIVKRSRYEDMKSSIKTQKVCNFWWFFDNSDLLLVSCNMSLTVVNQGEYFWGCRAHGLTWRGTLLHYVCAAQVRCVPACRSSCSRGPWRSPRKIFGKFYLLLQ